MKKNANIMNGKSNTEYYLNIMMNEGSLSTVFAICVVAITLGYSFQKWRESLTAEKDVSIETKIPEELKKLIHQPAFDVLTSICDTLIPAFKSGDIKEKIQDLLRLQNISLDNLLKSTDITEDQEIHLKRGAIASKVHIEVARAMLTDLLIEDRKQISLFLTILSYSAGNFLLTGFPVPFEELSLKYRYLGLRRLQVSSIPSMRGAFQAFKRLTGAIFLGSSCRNDDPNPSWKALQYEPVCSGKFDC